MLYNAVSISSYYSSTSVLNATRRAATAKKNGQEATSGIQTGSDETLADKAISLHSTTDTTHTYHYTLDLLHHYIETCINREVDIASFEEGLIYWT